MSQRNPMNERYTTESKRGVTRKSAASAKPKSQAAASVTVGTRKKTPAERKAAAKAARKAEQQRQRELDQKYYKPDTERYKKLRRMWWIGLVGAVICVCGSWLLRGVEPEWMAIVCLFLAYALIVFAFYIDFSKIRKERRAYQERMVALEAETEKEAKRSGKKNDQAKKIEEADAEDHDKKPVQQKSRRGMGARRKKAAEADAAKVAADSADDAEKADDSENNTEKAAQSA